MPVPVSVPFVVVEMEGILGGEGVDTGSDDLSARGGEFAEAMSPCPRSNIQDPVPGPFPARVSAAMHSEESQIRVSIDSRHEQIDLIQVEFDDALARLGLDDDSRYWVGVAVGEAVANAITHGNRQDPEKRVEVELAISDGEAVIRVVDQGDGLDVRWVGTPTSPENLLKPNGRGIFLMRSIMDEVEYNSAAAAGTAVELRKRFADPAMALATVTPTVRTSGHAHPTTEVPKERQ